MSFFRVGAGRVDADNVQEIKVNTDGTQFVEVTNLASSLESKLSDALPAGKAFVVTHKQSVAKRQFLAVQLTIPDDSTTLFYVDWSVGVQFPAELLINEGGALTSPTALTLQNRNRNSATTSAVTAGYLLQNTNPVTGGNTIYDNHLAFEKHLEPNDAGIFIAKNNTTYVLLVEQSKMSNSLDSIKINLTEIPA